MTAGNVYCYLIIGLDKALLIDTGLGMFDLRKYISSLTTLPLIVVNTHGHQDHTYGNFQFDTVFIKDEDIPILQEVYSEDMRSNTLKQNGGAFQWDEMTEKMWVNAKYNNTCSLNGIQCFDLGGRIIEVIDTPGHSRGSVCFLDSSERLLFTGDSVIEGPIMLFFNSSTKLDVYLSSLDKLIARKEGVDLILPSHCRAPLNPDFILDVKSAVEGILSGKIIGEMRQFREFFNASCLFKRFDNFSILYREDSI